MPHNMHFTYNSYNVPTQIRCLHNGVLPCAVHIHVVACLQITFISGTLTKQCCPNSNTHHDFQQAVIIQTIARN
jgi:hypothetical protein